MSEKRWYDPKSEKWKRLPTEYEEAFSAELRRRGHLRLRGGVWHRLGDDGVWRACDSFGRALE